MVTAVINKCKLFQCVSSFFKDESEELLTTLVGLLQILQNVLSSPCIGRFHETLKDILLDLYHESVRVSGEAVLPGAAT